MTAASYTDEGTFADYYWRLKAVSVNSQTVLPNLYHWIDTRQLVLLDKNQVIFDPARQPYKLHPRAFAYVVIEIDGVLHESYDFQVRIPVVETKSSPPPLTPPRFKLTVDEILGVAKPEAPPAKAAEVTLFRQQRDAKKAETAALKARNAELEAAALKCLRAREPKVTRLKDCENVCRAGFDIAPHGKFNIGPRGAKRIWDQLRPTRRSRKPATRRRKRKP